jgi:hypothetical protein
LILNLRPRDAVRAIAILGGAAVLVVTELVSDELASFFVDHPLLAGLLSGIILSLIAYWIIDAVLAALHEKRWAPLSTLAFKALAGETTLLIDKMAWLATGIEPRNEAAPSAADRATLAGLHARNEVEPMGHADLGAIDYADYEPRLRRLVSDREWLGFAHDRLDAAKWRNRDGIAAWAGPMLSTGESSDVLNRLAGLNESFSTIQEWLRALRGQEGYEELEASEAEASRLWFTVLAEAISVREDLFRTSGGFVQPWDKFRRALHPDDRKKAAERARRAVRNDRAARKVLLRPAVEAIRPPRRAGAPGPGAA